MSEHVIELLFTPRGHLGPALSAFWVRGVLVALLAIPLLVSALRARRNTRALRRWRERVSLGLSRRLAPGPVVLRGRVERADGHALPRIVVEERPFGASPEVPGGHPRLYLEAHRTVEATPFVLVLRDGRRVRVEPDHGVELRVPLSLSESTNRIRSRLAKLTEGAEVFVAGVLSAGGDPAASPFRGEGHPLVLASSQGEGERVLVSLAPFTDGAGGRARFHRRWAWAFLGLAALVHGPLLGSFHALASFGQVVEADVVAEAVPGRCGCPRLRQCRLSASWTDRTRDLVHSIRETVPAPACDLVAAGSVEHVPVVWSRPFGYAMLGSRPTVEGGRVVLATLVVGLAGLLYLWRSAATRPWWRRRRVHELVDEPYYSVDAIFSASR